MDERSTNADGRTVDDASTPTELTDADLSRRRFVQAAAVSGVAAGIVPGTASAAGGDLRAGVATRDITPENGGAFFGYVRPDMRASGVSMRLFAHALVLDDGERRVALISADLGKPMIREQVLEHARPLGFDRSTVLFSATHTHAGPGDVGDWIAGQIGDAIAEASENLQPARAGWASGSVERGNWNRSLAAHLENFGVDVPIGEATPEDHPVDPDRARDTTVRLLRVEGTDGTPIAAWSAFGNHPTAFTPANKTFSADVPGAAREWFASRFDDEAPVTVYANGRVGDQIPEYDDYGMYAVAERTGIRIERAMWDAWQTAGGRLSRNLPVDGRATTVTYDGQEVAPGKHVGDTALVGAPILDGGENGPTPFSGLELEGKRRPEWMADPVHGRKVIVAPGPYDNTAEVQALRVGGELLVTVPGEPTVETGRRMRKRAAEEAPEAVSNVTVVGITNGYNGYFTTPEEYSKQDYEGGHTVFGKYSSLLVENTHGSLASAFAAGPSAPAEPSGSRPSIPDAPVGAGDADGELEEGPPATVERMDAITIEWDGGWSGEDRPVDEPFLVLERRSGGAWETVATDLGLGFQWHEYFGEYSATFDVPPDVPTGTYRLRVTAAKYDLTTREFEIVPSTGLRVRGVETDSDGALVFVAQNPAPDPEENLRVRPITPRGGTLTYVVDGEQRQATWDAAAEGWVATDPDLSAGDAVTVPAGGLVDDLGNRNGQRADLTVDQVADLEWPESMETGGGNPPGLFGIGEFPM